MSNIVLKVNGKAHTLDIEPSTPLLYILRNDLGLQGPRFGCGLGQCGACMVIINHAAVRSCITPVSTVKGEITTLEGLAKDGKLHPLQQAWIDEQVPQCGFCHNGQIMTAKALLDKNPHPSDDQIRQAMAGTLAPPRLPYRSRGIVAGGGGGGALVGPFAIDVDAQGAARGLYPDPDYHQLDSWIVIHDDNTATFFVGKTDCGQGTGTSFRQMMSDELDIAFDKTTCVMGSTDITVDQGGSGGSDAIQTDGWPMRRVAAEARRVLLEMASARFAVPVDQLTVADGVVGVKSDAARKITYGELIGGKRFNVTLT